MNKDDKLIYEGWKDIAAAGALAVGAACSPGDPNCPPEEPESKEEPAKKPLTYTDLKLDNVDRRLGRYAFGSDEKGDYVASIISSYHRGNRTDDVDYKNFVDQMDGHAYEMMEHILELKGIRLLHGYDSYDIMGKHILKAYIDTTPDF